jgi:hypothetical protein
MKLLLFPILLCGFAGITCAQAPGDGPREPDRRARPESADAPQEGGHQIERMKRAMAELQQAGKHEEAEQMGKKLQAMLARQDGERDQSRGRSAADGPDRLRHLQEAIGHLRAAGLQEPAQDLERVAAKMKEQFEQQQHRGHDGGSAGESSGREIGQAMRETREQIGRMGRELQEVREQLRQVTRELQQMRERARGAIPQQ